MWTLLATCTVVLVPSVGCVSVCVWLMSWLQPEQAVANRSESVIDVGLAMNPMNSDFGGGSQAEKLEFVVRG